MVRLSSRAPDIVEAILDDSLPSGSALCDFPRTALLMGAMVSAITIHKELRLGKLVNLSLGLGRIASRPFYENEHSSSDPSIRRQGRLVLFGGSFIIVLRLVRRLRLTWCIARIAQGLEDYVHLPRKARFLARPSAHENAPQSHQYAGFPRYLATKSRCWSNPDEAQLTR